MGRRLACGKHQQRCWAVGRHGWVRVRAPEVAEKHGGVFRKHPETHRTCRREVAEKHAGVFEADRTRNLIVRLQYNVIRAGLRRINLAYSRISLADVAARLGARARACMQRPRPSLSAMSHTPLGRTKPHRLNTPSCRTSPGVVDTAGHRAAARELTCGSPKTPSASGLACKQQY